MVFPSVPVYLDPPNWNQQHAHQRGSGGGSGGAGEPPQLPPGAMAVQHPEGAMPSSIRPGSMADRARLAKLPQPEPALKCPRCDSTNTKFCYFNNYSLSQPRHFCKTCRRYWTRGGALRNVPVGGGCRRNKRTKPSGGTSSSKSSTATVASAGPSSSSSSVATCGGVGSTLLAAPQLPLMASLHPLVDYGAPNIGLSFTGIPPVDAGSYQVGTSGCSSSMGLENWRLQQIQQFPFLGGLEPSPLPPAPVTGLYPFEGEGGGGGGAEAGAFTGQVHPKASNSGLLSQLASVKMEDNAQGFNLPRHFGGVLRHDQFWGCGGGSGGGGGSSGSGWTPDISGFNSSSSGNLL